MQRTACHPPRDVFVVFSGFSPNQASFGGREAEGIEPSLKSPRARAPRLSSHGPDAVLKRFNVKPGEAIERETIYI